MARQKENSERTYVFLSKDDLAVLKRQAEKEGSNVSLILRRLAKEYISALPRTAGSTVSNKNFTETPAAKVYAAFDALPVAGAKQ